MGIELEKFVSFAPYLRDIDESLKYADEYSVPIEDVLLLGLNLSGIHYRDVVNDRGRFRITLPGGTSFRMATTITNLPITNFTHDGKRVLLGEHEVGVSTDIEKDTCTDTYWRAENHLTLNSNLRSLCRGCDFCGTYQLESMETPLTEIGELQSKAEALLKEVGTFKNVDAIGIVTGCFGNEDKIVEHIKNVRKVFSQVGFKGEIQYVGSQLRSEESIKEVVRGGPFALFLTIEVFSNREGLMKKQKSSLSLEDSRRLLEKAKEMGAETSFLYIAGIDPLNTVFEELPKFEGLVTRLPQIQTFQLYNPNQILLRNSESSKLDYFLKIRKETESIFPNLKPILENNYRGLWYTEYRGEAL